MISRLNLINLLRLGREVNFTPFASILLRNRHGKAFPVTWKKPDTEPIGTTSSTIAELMALHRGLELVLENGWDNVWIEGDPKTLLEIILNSKRVRSEEVHRLVRNINLIIPELNNCHLSHIYREGNRVADMLARMGHDSKYPRVWQNDPPEQLLPILHEDAEGAGILRKR
ncbi:hypothetical protein FRX31_005334 [Thalictrum thalictroides]|uniref:RNase H type-1 domain-containing protein n=1 Tax=Thalictrum thalictroides TaxID=46969 RepID=A0A7J6X854_THATH|nr:hypothetical protein FRX31_005334 [Thalictrum thalictroides]